MLLASLPRDLEDLGVTKIRAPSTTANKPGSNHTHTHTLSLSLSLSLSLKQTNKQTSIHTLTQTLTFQTYFNPQSHLIVSYRLL